MHPNVTPHLPTLMQTQNTDPHAQLIHYNVLLCYGRTKTEFFRSRRRWQPLIPLLMDHILVDIDPALEDMYFGTSSDAESYISYTVPIEAKLRDLGVKMLYEVCRVQKLSLQDLRKCLSYSHLPGSN